MELYSIGVWKEEDGFVLSVFSGYGAYCVQPLVPQGQQQYTKQSDWNLSI